MYVPKQCDEYEAVNNFSMRVAGASGRAATVKPGDRFWIKSSSLFNAKGSALIARAGGASMWAITLEDLEANFKRAG